MKAAGKITLYEIARLAGASKSTVSRVLMNQNGVSQETRKKIEKIMRDNGYQPNAMARGLAGGRTGMIAVVTPGIFSGYYAEILKGVDVVAHKRNVHVISSFAHGDEDYPELVARLARPGQVDGVVLVAPRLELFKKKAPSTSVPIVLVGAEPPREDRGWAKMDAVLLDNRSGVRDVLAHLVEQGCRRLLHVTGAGNVHDFCERRLAFEEFCRETKGVAGSVIAGGLTRGEAREALRKVFHKGRCPHDAIVACNDDFAIGALNVLKEQQLAAPHSVAVVGCDDEPAAETLGLTTLHMPMVELGEEAARLLFDRMEKNESASVARRSVVQMSLVVRGSSVRRAE